MAELPESDVPLLMRSKLDDHSVILEYQLPMTSKRLDFLICGKDEARKDNAVIIELKQWERYRVADGAKEVLTYTGGAEREALHPSARVNQHRMSLQDTHTAFYDGQDHIVLNACSYLHNLGMFVAPQAPHAVTQFIKTVEQVLFTQVCLRVGRMVLDCPSYRSLPS